MTGKCFRFHNAALQTADPLLDLHQYPRTPLLMTWAAAAAAGLLLLLLLPTLLGRRDGSWLE